MFIQPRFQGACGLSGGVLAPHVQVAEAVVVVEVLVAFEEIVVVELLLL